VAARRARSRSSRPTSTSLCGAQSYTGKAAILAASGETFESATQAVKAALTLIVKFSFNLMLFPPGALKRDEPPNRLAAGTHLLSLINEILDLAKIEAGKLELKPEPVNLARLIDEVIGAAGQLAEKPDS
jgi:two-component system cell cycle sensor histidine kinase PleC